MRSTGEEIADPFGRNHLAGIRESLQQNFRHKTFVSFMNSFIGVMSIQGNNSEKPWLDVDVFEQKQASWARSKQFDQLTEDKFWSGLCLKSLPDGDFKRELIRKVTKFIRDSEASDDYDGSVAMPIFKFIKEEVKYHKENNAFGDKPEVKKGGGLEKRSDVSENKYNGKRAFVDYRTTATNKDNIEKANSTEAYAAANEGNDNKKFSGEVKKSDNVTIQVGEKKHTYVAMKKQSGVCENCYLASNSDKKACAKMCYAPECNKCNYFGHKSYSCKQMFTVAGVKLEK